MTALLLAACRSEEEPPPGPDGPRARFDLSADAGVFDAPFPSVHREGRDLRDWPNPSAIPWVDVLIAEGSAASGAGTTSGVLVPFEEAVELVPVDAWRSIEPDAPAFLVDLATGERVPVDLSYDEDGGPFGAPHLLTMLPLQGTPLRPATTYAAVLRRPLGGLGEPEAFAALRRGDVPGGWSDATAAAYADALSSLPEDTAALAVFRTWDPAEQLLRFVDRARAEPLDPSVLVHTETFDTFCVFKGTARMPVYQEGEPPYLTSGGGWATDADGEPILQDTATSRLWVTVPRAAMPAEGFPVTVMVRTGGGGDRPLVDRGPRAEPGGEPIAPGTGPALELARAGYAGVQVDGPLGGPYRNPDGADEQFLVFNVSNPIATRDNVRQSALELALLPPILDALSFDGSACPGAPATVRLDGDTLALLGHSMGGTIAPLAAAAAPEYDALILSGFGGSYLENLVHKQLPIEVRPFAEALLGYSAIGRTLGEGDPVLQLLQWVAEPADPPVYADLVEAHVLMEQGIVDHYILPPIANAGALSLGLDLGGEALDAAHPDLAEYRPLEALLPLVGRERVALPAGGNRDVTRIVAQHPSDGIEDGHEVLFQTEAPKAQYRGFLEDLAAGRTPEVR